MNRLTFAPLLAALLLLATMNAEAIPAFARKEGMQCSGCHSAYPALNAMGRLYKTNGYRYNDEVHPGRKITDDLQFDKLFPISAGIESRPYDDQDHETRKNSAIHELELFIAGSLGDNFSGFAELEASEDEGEDFNAHAGTIQASYNYSPAINVQVSRANALYFDPYNSYTNMRRATIGRNDVINQPFGGADNGAKFRNERQNATLFGHITPELFYGVSYSGLADDVGGTDASTVVGRIAYDVLPNLMLGAVGMDGTCTSKSGSEDCMVEDRDYLRVGVDSEWTPTEDITLNAVFMQATDDLESGQGDETNNAYYVQAFYTFRKDNRPFFVPVLRYDSYEANDGRDDIHSITVGLTHYVTENLKARVEYWDRQGDGDVVDDNRITLQFDAFF